MKYVFGIGLALTLLMGGVACGSDNNAPTCTNVAGTWTITGTCNVNSCVVTQSGCSISMACTGGTFTGTVSGNDVTFSNSTAACSGSGPGNTASGTCATTAGTTCAWSSTRS